SILIAQNEKIKSKERIKQSSLFVEGQMTIKLKAGVGDYKKQTGLIYFGIPSLDEKVQEFGVYQLEKRFQFNPRLMRSDLPDLSRIYKLSYNSETSLNKIVAAFSANPNVEYAEGIPIYKVSVVPNDALYDDCQHLPQIMAEEAWNIHKGEDGTEEIVIAIVDTGTDWEHEDLVQNVWQNLSEDADGDGATIEFIDSTNTWVLDPGDLNGVDDDNNGFTDDLVGWNFINEDGDPNPILSNPMYNHGTLVTGIACGRTNNEIGISSISYNLKYMAVCADENNTLAYGYDGIIYAAENGADVISNSWGGGTSSAAGQEVIHYATGLGSIVIGAAGNDNIEYALYPASYLGAISVASVNEEDAKADYSNYHCSVDISAPGGEGDIGILSTSSDNSYEAFNGTSLATPLVAGVLGLLKSYHPTWTNEELIERVLATSDYIEDLNPGYENLLGHGRINAYEMLLGENIEDPYLKLGIEQIFANDANENGILEPGELVSLSFDIRNFMQTYGSDNVDVILTTSDADIIILTGEANIDIAADTISQLLDLFAIQIGDNAEAHYAEFNLHFESEMEIKKGEDIAFTLLISPSGYFVYDGDGEGENYSGVYIYNYLIDHGFNAMYGSGDEFPTSLNGFEAVFLSFGNFASGYTTFGNQHVDVVSNYLTDVEGDVYIESSDAFAYDQVGNTAFHLLFGLTSSNDGSTNPIDSLWGLENSLANGMAFTSSSQSTNSWIDMFSPIDEAEAVFEELDYGIVAVQYDVPDSYETFCFSYAISKLDDGNSPSTKDELLNEILIFFDESLSIGEEEAINPFNCKVYPNPNTGIINIDLGSLTDVSIKVLNLSGQLVYSKENINAPLFQFELDAASGIYILELSAEDEKQQFKLVKQ
ncbi:MAG: hypothetical protein DRI54_04560, partial [Bacteroidetes bacterium]